MCNHTFNSRLAPLDNQHVEEIVGQFPRHESFIRQAARILKENLTPQVNLLVALVVFKEQLSQGARGIFSKYGDVLYAPLSIVGRTGNHEWTRFRPQPVGELHSSFLSFMMAKENFQSLNIFLARHGLVLSRRHCCGILFGAIVDVDAFERSDDAALRNKMRSYAESMGMPVVDCSFGDIPGENSDLGPIEQDFYQMYKDIFSRMSIRDRSSFIDTEQDDLWDRIISEKNSLAAASGLLAA